jgi:very-short-patch-repair endonuclease
MRAPRIRIKDLPPEQQKEVRRLKRVITAAERAEFRAWCHAGGLPEPTPEHRFHPIREWRFDWAFLDFQVAIEIEGGVWTEGRHTRGAGFVEDMRKYNEAAVLGWTVLRVTPEQLYTGDTLDLLLRAISLRSEHPMTDTQQSPAPSGRRWADER